MRDLSWLLSNIADFGGKGRLRVLFHARHDEWLEEQAMSTYRRLS